MHVHIQALHLCTWHLYDVFVYTCVHFIVLHGAFLACYETYICLIICYKLSMYICAIVHFYISFEDPFQVFHNITLIQLLDLGICFRNALIL
jgi:hypothetical protein